MLHNFHCHGALRWRVVAVELIRRFAHAGYRTVAITDHAAAGSLEQMIAERQRMAGSQAPWIDVIPGVD